VYQRGVINPMTNIEQFWKDYIAFEQNINPIIAEKMGMERSRDYMNARRVAKEFEAATRGVNRNAPSVPPTGTAEEVKQVIFYPSHGIHYVQKMGNQRVRMTIFSLSRWSFGKSTLLGRKATL